MRNQIFLLVILITFYFATSAQKQPNVQQVSVRAPANIKIDGKLDEWGGKLQAYNNADRLFYTVSNDDEKLYLSILIKDHLAEDKLFMGGLTFTISHLTTKKRENDSNNPSITFPAITRKISYPLQGYIHAFEYSGDDRTASGKKHLDSLIALENGRVRDLLTEIKTIALKGVADTIMSIYNIEGVNTAIHFGEGMVCTYELAIPLKCLGLSVANSAPFSYNVKLNGNIIPEVHGAPPAPVPANGLDHDHEFEIDPTDFWGVYVLAKKP